MNYEECIASPDWAAKRKARLELDGHRCRLCDEDGSRYQLEVHHRPTSYAKIPNNSVEDDLITVCARCQNAITGAIRKDRYGIRELPEPTILENTIQEREDIDHSMANSKLQIDSISPDDNAQRVNGRPIKQVVKIDETDIIQARKDRRGP